MRPLTLHEVASRAGVEDGYVRRLADLGALAGRDDGYGERDVHRVALLHAWEAAGLAPETILGAVRQGELSFAFLETPGWALPPRPDRTYRELSEQEGVPLPLILGLHEAIGFQPPDPDEHVRHDELVMVELAGAMLEAGVSEAALRRAFHLYADNLRRLATAEAELYRAEVETRLREGGMTETDLMRSGSELGNRTAPLVHRTLLGIYERHRQHVWTEISVGHAEAALERAGLYQRVPRPPAICFVDLAGYTRLTEEQGDEVAARLAASRCGGWATAACSCSGSRPRGWRRPWRWWSALRGRVCRPPTSASMPGRWSSRTATCSAGRSTSRHGSRPWPAPGRSSPAQRRPSWCRTPGCGSSVSARLPSRGSPAR